MRTVTMNYPITISVEEDSNVSKAYAFDIPGVTVEYGSNGTAVSKMKNAVKAAVAEAIKFSDREYRQRKMIATKEGTVLLVMFENGHWGYYSAHDHGYAGSTWGRNSFEETLTDARNHANNSYGGILWECTC